MRLTHTGGADANVNFFMLATARNDLPRITNVYPDGTLQLQATNSFRFTASNPTVPIYSTNVNLTLNEVDVTTHLTLSGSVNSWNVSLPAGAQRGALHRRAHGARRQHQRRHHNHLFRHVQSHELHLGGEDYDFGSGQFYRQSDPDLHVPQPTATSAWIPPTGSTSTTTTYGSGHAVHQLQPLQPGH